MGRRTEDQLNKRLKGFHRTWRGKFKLLQDKVLTDSEFILWDFCFFVLADWDNKNHPEIYGSFDYTGKEVATLLGWSASKVSRNTKSLLNKGYLKDRLDHRIEVPGFEIMDKLTELTKGKKVLNITEHIANMKSEVADAQEIASNLQEDSYKEETYGYPQIVAKSQLVHSKEPLVSSKVNFSEEDETWANEYLKEHS